MGGYIYEETLSNFSIRAAIGAVLIQAMVKVLFYVCTHVTMVFFMVMIQARSLSPPLSPPFVRESQEKIHGAVAQLEQERILVVNRAKRMQEELRKKQLVGNKNSQY